MCIALSNYLHSRYFARTSYLEVNATHEIASLSAKTGYTTFFRHQGVLFYPELTVRSMADVLRQPCTYFVLDFGVPSSNTYREFLACDLRIVICHASIWKSDSLAQFVQQLEKYNIRQKTVKLICYGGKEKDHKQIAHKYGFQTLTGPFLKDPFHINSEFFDFFDQLMKGE